MDQMMGVKEPMPDDALPPAPPATTSAKIRDALALARTVAGLIAGKPVAEIQLRVMRDQWGEPLGEISGEQFSALCLPAGEAGEIVVSGDHVLQGYLGGHGDAETKFRVAGRVWHRTGDAGRLWLLGRCIARVTDSRGSIWPFAVECAAMADARVRRAALASVAGRRVLAVEGEGLTADDPALKAALAWASLNRIAPLARLPVDKRHNAKIDYPALRALLELTAR
jgi:acyl-CoA synthetase (AMP-forming)/AMP-acid ligase II